jgi:acetyl-CoA acyltransferase
MRDVYLIDGVRTPFYKAYGQVEHLCNSQLAAAAVEGLIMKGCYDPAKFDALIWGSAVVDPAEPNIARNVILSLGLPPSIDGLTLTKACLSSLAAIEHGIRLITTGAADVVIAGGSDSTSSSSMVVPRNVTQTLQHISSAPAGKKKLGKRLWALRQHGWNKVLPVPISLNEKATSLNMGTHADWMAIIHRITREEQDAYAAASQAKARAILFPSSQTPTPTQTQTEVEIEVEEKEKKDSKGSEREITAGVVYLEHYIVPLSSSQGQKLREGDLVRRHPTSPERLAQLPTVFGEGGITAASASPLTDGAAVVVLVSAVGMRRILGEMGDSASDSDHDRSSLPHAGQRHTHALRYRHSHSTAIDPMPQLLLGPAFAIPHCLHACGLNLADIDAWHVHEAFAAQVIAMHRCWGNSAFCRAFFQPMLAEQGNATLGTVDSRKWNRLGGSLAWGHPFGATGARLCIDALCEGQGMKEGSQLMVALCAAGGLGGAMLWETCEMSKSGQVLASQPHSKL